MSPWQQIHLQLHPLARFKSLKLRLSLIRVLCEIANSSKGRRISSIRVRLRSIFYLYFMLYVQNFPTSENFRLNWNRVDDIRFDGWFSKFAWWAEDITAIRSFAVSFWFSVLQPHPHSQSRTPQFWWRCHVCNNRDVAETHQTNWPSSVKQQSHRWQTSHLALANNWTDGRMWSAHSMMIRDPNDSNLIIFDEQEKRIWFNWNPQPPSTTTSPCYFCIQSIGSSGSLFIKFVWVELSKPRPTNSLYAAR